MSRIGVNALRFKMVHAAVKTIRRNDIRRVPPLPHPENERRIDKNITSQAMDWFDCGNENILFGICKRNHQKSLARIIVVAELGSSVQTDRKKVKPSFSLR